MGIPDTVQIGGPLAPTAETDTYPTHFDRFGVGGYRAVANAAARDAIPAARRAAGMQVKLLDTGVIYSLGVDLTTWTEEPRGGGLTWVAITTSTLAQAGYGYFVNAAAGPVVLTLPADPAVGAAVGVVAIDVTNPVTVARNGKLLLGSTVDRTVNKAADGVELRYSGDSFGWTPVSELASASSADDFSLRSRGWVNVKDFNAVGDGVTDDTAAFLAAIAHIKALRNMSDHLYVPSGLLREVRTLFIPAGTYKITQTLLVDFAGLHILGEGKNSSVLIGYWTPSSNTDAVIAFGVFDPNYPDPWTGASATGYSVIGIAIYSGNNIVYGRQDQGRLGCAILSSNSSNGVIRDCGFGFWNTGILSAYGCWGTQYEHIDFANCDYGLSLFDVDEVQVLFCQCYWCWTGIELLSAHQITLTQTYFVGTVRPLWVNEDAGATRLGTIRKTGPVNTLTLSNCWFEELPVVGTRHWREAIYLVGTNTQEIHNVHIHNTWFATMYADGPESVVESYFMTYGYVWNGNVSSLLMAGYASAYLNVVGGGDTLLLEDIGPTDRWSPDTTYGFGFLPLYLTDAANIHFIAKRTHTDVYGADTVNNPDYEGYFFGHRWKSDPSASAAIDNKNRQVRMQVVGGPRGFSNIRFQDFKRHSGGWSSAESIELDLDRGTLRLNGYAMGFWPSTSGTPTTTEFPANSKLWNSSYAAGRPLGWSYNGATWDEIATASAPAHAATHGPLGDDRITSLRVDAGSTAAPSLAVYDADTGFWFESVTGTVCYSINGVQRMRLGSTLILNGNTVWPSTTSLPNLGITGVWAIGADNSGTIGSQFNGFNKIIGFACMRANGSAATPTALVNNDYIASFAMYGFDGVDYSSPPSAAFECYATESWSETAHGCGWVIGTTDNGTTTRTPKLRITDVVASTALTTVLTTVAPGTPAANEVRIGAGTVAASVVAVADGTVAAPALAFTGSAGTGVSHDAIGGKVKVSVDGGEKLAIGQHIVQNANVTPMGTAGNVLPPQNAGFHATAADGQVAGMSLTTFGAGSVIRWYRAEGTAAAPTKILANQTIGQFAWRGYDGAAYRDVASMTVYAATDYAPGTTYNAFYSFVVYIGGTATEVLRMYSNVTVYRQFVVSSAAACDAPGANGVNISAGTIKCARTADAGAREVVLGDDTRVAAVANKLDKTGGTLTNELVISWTAADLYSRGSSTYKRGTTGDANAAVTSGTEIGYHSFWGWTGSNYRRGAYAMSVTTENWAEGATGTKYIIAATSTGTSGAVVVAEFTRDAAADPVATDRVVIGGGDIRIGRAADAAGRQVVAGDDTRMTNARPTAWVGVPASAAASGTAGQMAYDADYLYVCTAANTWARFAKAAW